MLDTSCTNSKYAWFGQTLQEVKFLYIFLLVVDRIININMGFSRILSLVEKLYDGWIRHFESNKDGLVLERLVLPLLDWRPVVEQQEKKTKNNCRKQRSFVVQTRDIIYNNSIGLKLSSAFLLTLRLRWSSLNLINNSSYNNSLMQVKFVTNSQFSEAGPGLNEEIDISIFHPQNRQ